MTLARSPLNPTPSTWTIRPVTQLVAVGLVALSMLLVGTAAASFGSAPATSTKILAPPGVTLVGTRGLGDGSVLRVLTTPGTGPLNLSVSALGASVCAFGESTCSGVPATLRVRLTAEAPNPGLENSTPVQILYLLDVSQMTTACGPGGDEVPGNCVEGGAEAAQTFLASAGTIATTLQANHPSSNLTFALAATEGSGGPFDDNDSPLLAVPLGNFTNATQFGPSVNRSLEIPFDIDTDDNPLQSGVVAALYGAFTGQTGVTWNVRGGPVNWTAGDDHVVVWMGATAPVDANYSEDVCPVRYYGGYCLNSTTGGNEPSCETPLNFSGGPVPRCEGWITSQNGVPTDSIAALSFFGGSCATASLGHCVVDSVIVNATSTDPASPGWDTTNGSGANLSDVRADARHIVAAGCDLTTVTGGSWDGPRNTTCGNSTGTLEHESNASDPELVSSLENISLGSLGTTGGVAAPPPGEAMFQFVPAPGFTPAPSLNASVTCQSSNGTIPDCGSTPSVSTQDGRVVLGWNWSSAPGHADMVRGDVWSAAFDLVATVGPSNATPVDECATPACVAIENESASVAYSGVEYSPWGLSFVLDQSFPLVEVQVAAPAALAGNLSVPSFIADAPASLPMTLSTSGGYPPFEVDWQFGDGGTLAGSGALVVEHTYSTAGLYRLQAQLTDSEGATLHFLRWITILPPLVANVSPTNATGGAPLFVSFGADPTGGDAPYTVSWNFGNGSTADGMSAAYTFGQPGNYSVTVRVTDTLGRTVSSTIPVSVGPEASASVPAPLSANASAAYIGNSGCGISSAKVLFSARATGGVAPYDYHWNFGDGSFGLGPNVNHTYGKLPAPLRVSLVVTDSSGRIADANVTSASGPTPADTACPATEIDAVLSPMDLTLGSVGLMAGAAIALVVLWRRE
jgi:hypothetical protein